MTEGTDVVVRYNLAGPSPKPFNRRPTVDIDGRTIRQVEPAIGDYGCFVTLSTGLRIHVTAYAQTVTRHAAASAGYVCVACGKMQFPESDSVENASSPGDRFLQAVRADKEDRDARRAAEKEEARIREEVEAQRIAALTPEGCIREVLSQRLKTNHRQTVALHRSTIVWRCRMASRSRFTEVHVGPALDELVEEGAVQCLVSERTWKGQTSQMLRYRLSRLEEA